VFRRAELQRALDADELILIYQAQVDMRSGTAVGVECAIRWRHPEQAVLHAMKFVNDVPPAGLAPDYMRFIVRTATRQMARWRSESVPFGRAAINVWPVSIGRELIDDALRAASDAGVRPSDVEIESQPEAVYGPQIFRVLQDFRDAGLRVALDDFGEGNIHFTNLRDAPFDVVKLPVHFVKRAGAMYDDTVIAAGVGFARSIGAQTVAEGVETVTIRDRVRELGCDIGQGYLWSQQVHGDELPGVLRVHRDRWRVGPARSLRGCSSSSPTS
jgi:EAL domain-containing protein (putative c-di-GMP-specific phosphodiesterase class I)